MIPLEGNRGIEPQTTLRPPAVFSKHALPQASLLPLAEVGGHDPHGVTRTHLSKVVAAHRDIQLPG